MSIPRMEMAQLLMSFLVWDKLSWPARDQFPSGIDSGRGCWRLSFKAINLLMSITSFGMAQLLMSFLWFVLLTSWTVVRAGRSSYQE
jgi:hypothetical protein